ncbi:glycoside hydrolase N-terminal domain-containing protein, partial [Actinosynnema sp. NPDC023658]|uniref:glycoside hydrolase N-terminal domain-containing protein n=1 Tax=Actinosynnema sp. NPDC023658 TaxID=3155465 RepID=UPI0033FE5BC4
MRGSVAAAVVLGLAPGVAVPEAEQAVARVEPGSLTLWYDEPAADWEGQSLPIGSGALGGGVFGTVARERIQLNEKTLWTGGPGSVQGYDFGNWT